MILPNNNSLPFSNRHGHAPKEREISIREDIPQEFREAFLLIATDVCQYPSVVRDIICKVLKRLPNRDNWSEYPNVWEEIQGLVLSCEWFRVYDIAEAVFARLAATNPEKAEIFQQQINQTFKELGIGWQLTGGLIQTRGPEVFESSVRTATTILDITGRITAKSEMHEALVDLSRKPEPDLTGAIQHAMVALECVARDICGESKATLGEIIKKHPNVVPRPLDDVISKAWGYASEMARHLKEGRTPDREEAELIVGLAAICATYIVQKHKGG